MVIDEFAPGVLVAPVRRQFEEPVGNLEPFRMQRRLTGLPDQVRENRFDQHETANQMRIQNFEPHRTGPAIGVAND